MPSVVSFTLQILIWLRLECTKQEIAGWFTKHFSGFNAIDLGLRVQKARKERYDGTKWEGRFTFLLVLGSLFRITAVDRHILSFRHVLLPILPLPTRAGVLKRTFAIKILVQSESWLPYSIKEGLHISQPLIGTLRRNCSEIRFRVPCTAS